MANKQTKAIGVCNVGDKGQIVIPANIRKMFDINPGDSLVILADIEKGIALVKADAVHSVADTAFNK